jgi:hypothetical protein
MAKDITDHLKLLNDADAGKLDALECPHCHRSTVSVSFTHPAADAYRVWFNCAECSFSMRAQYVGQPRHYSEDRVDANRQAYDVELLQKCVFPLP